MSAKNDKNQPPSPISDEVETVSRGFVTLCDLMVKDIDMLPMKEIESTKNELAGTFPALVAQALITALQLTRVGGKLNITESVRFLLGAPNLTTHQAKQFIKRLLTLDKKGKMVLEEFVKSELHHENETLESLVSTSKYLRSETNT